MPLKKDVTEQNIEAVTGIAQRGFRDVEDFWGRMPEADKKKVKAHADWPDLKKFINGLRALARQVTPDNQTVPEDE